MIVESPTTWCPLNSTLDKRFGEALQQLRHAAGKSQEDMSIGRTYMSELERGLKTPTLKTIVKLAAELGTTPARLVELATADERKQNPVPMGMTLGDAFKRVLGSAAPIAGGVQAGTRLGDLEEAIQRGGLRPAQVLAQSALQVFRQSDDRTDRTRRSQRSFLVADKREESELAHASDGTPWVLSPKVALDALRATNDTLELTQDVLGLNDVPFFELLGTRNLGSFVGAVFVHCLQKQMPDRLRVNGHQDGYPDLCALTTVGKAQIAGWERAGQADAEKSWASYEHGGIEVKTTCGSVPTATKSRKKPGLGEQRYRLLTGLDWKAHHRETNNLLGLYWDFIGGTPTALALFYRNDLSSADWGKIVVPTPDDSEVAAVQEGTDSGVALEVVLLPVAATKGKKPNGRTTSVSIMTKDGVKKMGQGWVALPDDPEILSILCQPKIFALTAGEIGANTSGTIPNFAAVGKPVAGGPVPKRSGKGGKRRAKG